jgi:DNA invertase Pin-like site-specific DNA recombinase
MTARPWQMRSLWAVHGATLLIVKLDRLARNANFISNLMERLLRARGAELLSVLRTCVTKQTKDLRYMGRGTLMVPELRSYAR